MRKGKLTQAALSRSVLRLLEENRETVSAGPAYGRAVGAFATEKNAALTMTACGVSAGFPEKAPEFAVAEACGHLLAAGAEAEGITVQLLLPAWYEERELRELMRRIGRTAEDYGAAVFGGHTEIPGYLSRPELSVTVVGHGNELPGRPAAGMELVVAGTCASSAAAYLAAEEAERLRGCFSERFLSDAAGMGKKKILPEAVELIRKSGGFQKAVCRGGIFGALWELAEYAGLGMEAELRKIPIRQETVEICEFFRLNPYQLFCTDTVLAAVSDGEGLVRELSDRGIPAAVIGRLTDRNERILRNGEEIRYLDKPQTDEWYRFEEMEKTEEETGKEEGTCQD